MNAMMSQTKSNNQTANPKILGLTEDTEMNTFDAC